MGIRSGFLATFCRDLLLPQQVGLDFLFFFFFGDISNFVALYISGLGLFHGFGNEYASSYFYLVFSLRNNLVWKRELPAQMCTEQDRTHRR